MHRNTRRDRLALPMHDAWSLATWPPGAVAWSTTPGVITHRIERELFELSRLFC